MTFSYTSGTTGDPKGAMLSHKNFVGVAAMFCTLIKCDGYSENVVYISYLPLPHVLEIIFVSIMCILGYSMGFYSGDVLKLKEDLIALRLILTFYFH
jgi:long-chain acyl-CoA synthetase